MGDRADRLAVLRAAANKKYGHGTIELAGRMKPLPVPRLTTGSLSFDYALGGGLPVGHVTIFRGSESSGKTTAATRIGGLAQDLCANCLRRPAGGIEVEEQVDEETGEVVRVAHATCDCARTGLFRPRQIESEDGNEFRARAKRYQDNSYEEFRVAYLDVEGTFEDAWALQLGCDPARMVRVRTATAEETIDLHDELVRTGSVDLLVIDSLAAMTPNTEVEASSVEWQQGLQARLLNKFCVDGAARVITKDGTVKRVQELVSGDQLRAIDKDGAIIWRKVKSAWSNGLREVVQFGDLRVTGNHRMCGAHAGDGISRFLPVEEMTSEWCLARPRVVSHDASIRWEDGRARLLGYLIGDGSWSGQGGPSLCAFDAAAQQEVAALVAPFGCHLNVDTWRLSKNDDLPGGSHRNPIREWLREIGVDFAERSRTKIFPSAVFQLPLDQIAECLSGLWMADGWVTKQDIVGLTTTSERLAYQVRDLLLRFSVWANINYVPVTQSYRVTITGMNAFRVRNVLRITGEKGERLGQIVEPRGCCDQDWLMDNVVALLHRWPGGDVARVIGKRKRGTYPEWNKPGRIKLDRREVEAVGCFYGDADVLHAAREQVWWERLRLHSCPDPVEVWDVEMEWDDADGEPNFEVEGYFSHNSRKVTAARQTVRSGFGRPVTEIWINQERKKIGVSYGDDTIMPGGEGQKFTASVVAKFWASKWERETVDEAMKKEWQLEAGTDVQLNFKIIKNKTARAMVQGGYRMGVAGDQAGAVLDLDYMVAQAEKFGLLRKDGAKWLLGDEEHKTKTAVTDRIAEPAVRRALRERLVGMMLAAG